MSSAKKPEHRRRWTDLFEDGSAEGGVASLAFRAEAIAKRQSVEFDAGMRLCLQPDALMPGNRFEPLIDGAAAYQAMLDAIESAEHTIDLETYIWEGDALGHRFAALLERKARAGVRVRAMADGAGAWAAGSILAQLHTAGAHLAFFHPMTPWRRRWGWSVRDHRKLLIVDARVAFTGGFNLANEQAPTDWGGLGWHDIHARIEGPSVRALQRLFDDAFRYASGERGRGWSLLREPRRHAHDPTELSSIALVPETPPHAVPPAALAHPAAHAQLQALAVGRRRDRRFIQRHYQYAVAMSRVRVSIFCSYFIPNASWRRTLTKAARRGVDVRVLVPRINDIPAVHYASRFSYQSLLDAGVRIYEYLPTMMHAKALVVDDAWCAIGSYNLDQRSLMYNWEISVAAVDARACAQLEAQFEADIGKSREIDPARWSERGWREKFKERFFYLFRLLL